MAEWSAKEEVYTMSVAKIGPVAAKAFDLPGGLSHTYAVGGYSEFYQELTPNQINEQAELQAKAVEAYNARLATEAKANGMPSNVVTLTAKP